MREKQCHDQQCKGCQLLQDINYWNPMMSKVAIHTEPQRIRDLPM